MNFWTFLDRNAEGLWMLAALIIFFAGSCGVAAGTGKGCQVQVGSPPAQQDAGAGQ